MSAIKNINRIALRKLRGDLGQPTFRWKGSDVPCVQNTTLDADELVEGGYQLTDAITLFVDRVEFFTVDTTLVTVDSDLWTADSDLPPVVTGNVFLFEGRSYRAESASYSPGGAHLVIRAEASKVAYSYV